MGEEKEAKNNSQQTRHARSEFQMNTVSPMPRLRCQINAVEMLSYQCTDVLAAILAIPLGSQRIYLCYVNAGARRFGIDRSFNWTQWMDYIQL